MKETISQALDVEGNLLIHIPNMKAELIKQSRDILDKAEKYGANTPNQMKEEDRNELRRILTLLGQKVEF